MLYAIYRDYRCYFTCYVKNKRKSDKSDNRCKLDPATAGPPSGVCAGEILTLLSQTYKSLF